ncbi:MAG: DNA-primase RepB domain-containing protein [Caldilineaceae bacterium]
MTTQLHTNQLRSDTEQLLAHLHRGGRFAHLWTDCGNRSYWFKANSPSSTPRRRHVPQRWLQQNVYFTVHPLERIPPCNLSGNTDRRFISSQVEYISAINTLFAEFDGKDTVLPIEYHALLPAGFHQLRPVEQRQARKGAQEQLFYSSPLRFKRRSLHQIEALYYPPSVIIDSGGGYHCYWLLRDPLPLDETNRGDVQVVQHSWVRLMGGDAGAADLRRVLRLPGTYNHKAGFANGATGQPPRVSFVKANFGLLYDYGALEEAVSDWLYAKRPRHRRGRRTWHNVNVNDQAVRAQFNQQHKIVDLLTAHGYQITMRHPKQTRLARPGHTKSLSSVSVFPTAKESTPELSVHFSTNDALYSEEVVSPADGQMHRRVHDAFYIYVMLTHNGDWQAAYAAAQLEQQAAR